MKINFKLINNEVISFKVDKDVLGKSLRDDYVSRIINDENGYIHYFDSKSTAIPKSSILYVTIEW